jgi:hypothetical protein
MHSSLSSVLVALGSNLTSFRMASISSESNNGFSSGSDSDWGGVLMVGGGSMSSSSLRTTRVDLGGSSSAGPMLTIFTFLGGISFSIYYPLEILLNSQPSAFTVENTMLKLTCPPCNGT